MVYGSHDHLTTKCFYSSLNAFIISSYISLIQHTDHLFIYSLYHRFASQ